MGKKQFMFLSLTDNFNHVLIRHTQLTLEGILFKYSHVPNEPHGQLRAYKQTISKKVYGVTVRNILSADLSATKLRFLNW